MITLSELRMNRVNFLRTSLLFSRFVFALMLTMGLSGCGYSFRGGSTILPPDVRKIYIPTVENNTVESGITLDLTEALREQFERYGVFTVVEREDEADATLRARVVGIVRDEKTVTVDEESDLEYDTKIWVAGELRRASGGLLWQNPRVEATRSFGSTSSVVVVSSPDFASGTLGATSLRELDDREVARGQERQVLTQLATDVAEIVYDEAAAADF
jgi:outer membrane lipopolysaccharide assembly protein LptE/RlpB